MKRQQTVYFRFLEWAWHAKLIYEIHRIIRKARNGTDWIIFMQARTDFEKAYNIYDELTGYDETRN